MLHSPPRPWSGCPLLPTALLELHPVAQLGPLAGRHDDQAGRATHATATVSAVAVLEPPAWIPVLDRLDRLQERVAGQVPPVALQGLHEEGGLLIAVQVRGVLLHVGPVEIEEGAGLGG